MEHVTERTLHAIDEEIMKLIEGGEMSKETLACLDKLVDMKKDTLETSEMESKEMSQNSFRAYDMMPRETRSMGYHPYHEDMYGSSYAQRRDSMGRYSRNSERDQIRANIEAQLNTAQTDAERDLVHRILSAI